MRRIKFALAVFVSVLILLSACNRGSHEEFMERARALAEMQEQQTRLEPKDRNEREIGNYPIHWTEENHAAVQEAINSFVTVYPHSELFFLDEALERRAQMPPRAGVPQVDILANGRITADELFDLVTENNRILLEERSLALRRELDEEFLRFACELIAEVLTAELARHNFVNLDEIRYNVANLYILQAGRGMASGYISTSGGIGLNPNIMNDVAVIRRNPLSTEITIVHEVQHLLQWVPCRERERDTSVSRAFGFMYEFEDLKVNSMYWDWFIEAAAERLAVDFLDAEVLAYITMVSYLDSLTFVNIFRDDVGVHDVARLTQQPSLEEFFAFFNAETPDEQREILNFFYAVEIIQLEPQDFMDIYEEWLGHPIELDDLIQLKVELRIGALETLTKAFYSNLSQAMVGRSIDLHDIFRLIAMYEATYNTHFSYDNPDRFHIIRGSLGNYLKMQDAFFAQIAEVLGVGVDDIKAGYNAYNAGIQAYDPSRAWMNPGDVGETIYMTWMTPEENRFLQQRFTFVLQRKEDTVRQMMDALTQYFDN